ncbi:MAG: HAMP domain-containing sensor histidine kinase [Thiovulaceae bacterium]|nr:HAMP domain-containing sensor histidine kinase [Sulfurimonadaceae bacterium]
MMMKQGSTQKNLEDEVAFLSKKILELNKRLIGSEKAKSRFLSLVTSELNNPMTVLVGMVPHLQLHVCEKNEKIYPMVNQEVLNLDFKIKNLVMTARIESGDLDVSYALVDPLDIIDEVTESLKYIIEEKKIHLHVNNQINKKIVADPQIIYTIARNLISNACLYGTMSSAVEIIIRKENSIFIISVKNYGDGPKLQNKPEIFKRFSDGPDGEHGLGIGLSIVRALCERFDGTVDFSVDNGIVTFVASLSLDEEKVNSKAYGSNEFLFESFDDAIEI